MSETCREACGRAQPRKSSFPAALRFCKGCLDVGLDDDGAGDAVDHKTVSTIVNIK